MADVFKVIQGVLLSLSSLMVLYFVYYWIPVFADEIIDPFFKVVYYIGVIGMFFTFTIIAPLLLIFKGAQHGES